MFMNKVKRIFNKIKPRKSHLFISAFVTINVTFLFLVAGFFVPKSDIHAQAACQPGNTDYFATVKIVVSTTNGAPLPSNIGLHTWTDTCYNGWDNGIPFNSGYNQNLQDWFEASGPIQGPSLFNPSTPGTVSAQQIINYYNQNHSAPSTFQDFGEYNVGNNALSVDHPSNGIIASCPSNTGCSHLGGNISLATVGGNNASSVTLEYYQVIDCAFSPVNYQLLGIPSGWTSSGTSNTVNVTNSPAVPTYNITLTPPTPSTPQYTCTISLSASPSNPSSGQATDLAMHLVYMKNGTSVNAPASQYINLTESPVNSTTSSGNGGSSPNFYTNSSGWVGVWETPNSSNVGKVTFTASSNNDYPGTTTPVQCSNTYSVTWGTPPTIVIPVLSTVTLACAQGSTNMVINWTYNSNTVNSSDNFYGSINDTTTNTNNVFSFNQSANNGNYTWNGANATDNYVVVGVIKGTNGMSNTVTSSSANISSCKSPSVPVLASVSLACLNNTTDNLAISWTGTNVSSQDNFEGFVTDTTTNTQVATIPTTVATLGEYIWQGANGKDSYTVTGWIVGPNGNKHSVTTTSSVASTCIPTTVTTQAPIIPSQVQQLPQTSGSSPLDILAAAGSIIVLIGVGLLML